ncbi:head decoration protein, partial [Wolbachia endosymbiont of Nasonia oneida]
MSCIIEQNNLGDLLKYEVSSLYSRDQITVAKGQNIKLGTVVAKKTDDGFIRVDLFRNSYRQLKIVNS